MVLEGGAYLSGDIRSASAYYTFTGELLGTDPYTGQPTSNVAYVDVTDWGSNDRFRAQVTVYADRFELISNVYEGLYSTAYTFTCQ